MDNVMIMYLACLGFGFYVGYNWTKWVEEGKKKKKKGIRGDDTKLDVEAFK